MALLTTQATRRVHALHARSFGEWLKTDILDALAINVANYLAGPGAAHSHILRAQPVAELKYTFETASLPSRSDDAGVRRTVRGLSR